MTIAKKKAPTINLSDEQKEAVERFLDDFMSNDGPTDLAGISDFTKQIKKRFLERVLDGELDHHLHACPAENDEPESAPEVKNKRNGKYQRKLMTGDNVELEIDVPRDRNGTFQPQVIPRHARRLDGFDDQVIELYSRGMSTRDIQEFIRKLYGYEISPALISEITDRVLDDIKEWQNRPLDSGYPVVFFDAIRLKIRSAGATVINKALHIAFAIGTDGRRDVLGMWLADNEGAKFWQTVFSELKCRGVKDVLIAVSDGLQGMTGALETTWPDVQHQTCIVHLIRNSTSGASYKDLKAICKALKNVYQAPSAEAAEQALDAFEESDLGKRYKYIAHLWRNAWEQVIPFFTFSPEVRKLIYTTNCIEGLNRCIRKSVKTRGSFPTDDAAKKLCWLAMKRATKDWQRRVQGWTSIHAELMCIYGDRYRKMVEE